MKLLCAKFRMAVLLLGTVLAAPVAHAQLQELHVMGSGTGLIGCAPAITPGCVIWGWGDATGTLFVGGTFEIRLDLGSPPLQNGYPNTQEQGVCLPASLRGRLTAANTDSLTFNHVGIVCEEANLGSGILYNGTFRVREGTGQFATTSGGGSLTVTWTRATATQPITAFFHLHGTVQ